MGIYEFTSDELNRLIVDVGVSGGLIGFLFGAMAFAGLYWLMKQSYMRNFKMWILQLDAEEKKIVLDNFESLMKTMDKLSKTNTKYIKYLYNDLNRLKEYIYRKWLQN